MLNEVFWEPRYFPKRPIPGPPPMPVLGWRGNLVRLMRDPIGYLRHIWRNYGTFAAVTLDHPAFVCAFGPEYNRVLFSENDSFEQYFTTLPAPPGSPLEHFMRNALVANGAEHARQRRAMTAPFLKRQNESYAADMVAVAERTTRSWQNGAVLELTHALRYISLGTILQVVFGIDASAEPALFARAQTLLGRFLARMGSELAIAFPVDFPRTPYRLLLEDAAEVEAFLGELLARRLRAEPATDVPSQLDAANRKLLSPTPEADLVGQLVTLLLAGQETTNNALAWTLFLLAQHPRILADVSDELSARLRGALPTARDLEQLPLLDRVVRESLRILPPAANGARRAVRDITLGKHELPAKTIIIFSEFISHHIPEVFREPERFRPERWLDLKPSSFEYFPFGAGARACIGNHFATLEMKLSLAVILQRYWPEVAGNVNIDLELKPALAPRPGIPVVLRAPGSRIVPARVTGAICDAVILPAS